MHCRPGTPGPEESAPAARITSFRDAALVEPLACVVSGVEDLQLRSGQRVLVLGAGPIGLMFVSLAREAGCEVTVAGHGAARLKQPNARARQPFSTSPVRPIPQRP